MDHETMVLSPVATVAGPAFTEPNATGRIMVDTAIRSAVVAPMDRDSLLVLIRQQIEFYFSEENLPKDVFLLKQLEKDKTKEGYVSLKVLAGFPKMKRLTHDLGAIREAVEGSDLVVLSPDGLSVKRKVPIVLPEDTTEKRTLYVTRLPKDCDRESLMLVFSEFGVVIRLDLPMDKKTGEHKGMAFVEYHTEEQVRLALEGLSNSAKYKMVAKPFKSRNSKEAQNAKNTELQESDKDDSVDDDAEESDAAKLSPRSKDTSKRTSSGTKKRNSKELQQQQNNQSPNANNEPKRNSKELLNGNSNNKRNSKEAPTNKDNAEPPKRNSKEAKDEKKASRDSKQDLNERRKSKEGNQDASKDKRSSKEPKQSGEKRTSKEVPKRTSKELTGGREVPIVPDSAYESQNSFSQARARGGSRSHRNSKDVPQANEWEDAPSNSRPKSYLLKAQAAEDRPPFVPVRSPFGPPSDGFRGFSVGRGKILAK